MLSYPLIKRFRLYREHKYIIGLMSELLARTAKTAFADKASRQELLGQLDKFQCLLEAHADYEESRIHSLLKQKGSLILAQTELEHRQHTGFFQKIKEKFDTIDPMTDEALMVAAGHEIYLDLRAFVAENIQHLNHEEQVILPELQRLYTDEEIREIDYASYRQMNAEDMFQMLAVLFPYMNQDDKHAFLSELQSSEPDKFKQAWPHIAEKLMLGEKL